MFRTSENKFPSRNYCEFHVCHAVSDLAAVADEIIDDKLNIDNAENGDTVE